MPKPRVNTHVTNIFNKCECVLTHLSQTLGTPWAVARQAPRPWNSPGKSTGVGCRCLLQGLFGTQGSNLPAAPTLAGRFLPAEPPGKQYIT